MSLENFHDDLVPSLNSKTGRGSGDFGYGDSAVGVRGSGKGDRSSDADGDCFMFNLSGEGWDLFCGGCFSNSFDVSRDTFDDGSGDDATTA